MQEIVVVYLACAAAVFFYMTTFFVLGIVRRKNDVADVAWGLGFILVAGLSFALGAGEARSVLVSTLVLAWGLRLAAHIYLRNRGKAEDYRYKAWREKWGKRWIMMSFLQVFMLQGLLMLAISATVIAANVGGGSLGPLDAFGAAVWMVGFYCEARADAELSRFVKDPAKAGKVLDTGIWRYSRHPNYFGEMTMWWGLWLVALGVSGAWWTAVSPLTITLLLTKVSGIPLLEKRYASDPAYQAYAKRTSALIPWFPRKEGPTANP